MKNGTNEKMVNLSIIKCLIHSFMKSRKMISQKQYVMYKNGYHFWNQHARIS